MSLFNILTIFTSVLKRVLVYGGYIEGTTYHFYLNDHLGNNRVVANASGTLVQKNHYYPFGSVFASTTGAGKQPYKYNGKELDAMHGLNLYDYSARYYESGIGRFTSVDPHAENYYSWSPYVYSYNNPIRYIDSTGEGPGDVIRGIGEGFVGTFKSIGNAIAHPIETVKQAYNNHEQSAQARVDQMKRGDVGGALLGTIGDATVRVGDMMTGGQVSIGINTVNALSYDLNGGDGSATGRVIGGVAADAAIVVTTAKMGQAVSSAFKEASAVANSTVAGTTLSTAEASSLSKNVHGNLTNGTYTVSQEAMKKHVFGGVQGKSLFYPTLDANKAVLKAAEFADKNNLWLNNKAKVPVTNTNIGTLGNGQPTNIINVYKNSKNTIHGSPGR
ncbi:RHS repeat-associated core domain-containing protein [Dysgonomonas sp. 521]|uniref:RHS repeat-associated core domain-containing protein n=1 Tax=Dysgonomonas sp. 521 TaxID=2302932 RepID=UPI00210798DF|nr:RHS repeat-associated core domain-containing protein [Dysgonomonas sp. 521]